MKMVPLGEVAEFINGYAFKSSDWHESGLPIIRIQNLTDPEKPFNLSNKTVPEKYVVETGDTLVSWSASLGVFSWSASTALLNQHIFKVVPLPGVDAKYLRYILEAALVSMKRHLHGATMKHINRAEFLSTQVPLPPLNEQRRIAAILDKADAIRQKRRQAIVNLDTLTQSTLEDFSRQTSHEVESFRFQDIVDSITTGRSPNCEARPAETGEWGILKLSAVTTGTFRSTENKAFTGDPQLISRYEIHDGDLMMTRKNTPDLVGAVSIAHAPPPRLSIPDIVFRIAPNPELANNVYLQALLMSPNVRSQVKSLAGGSAKSMSNISATRLKTLELQLPSLESQEAFSTVVQRIQLNRNRHQASFDLEHNLVTSLQSRAFRGEL